MGGKLQKLLPNTTYLNVTHVGPVEHIHLEQAPQIFRLATPFVVEKRQPRERAGQVLLDERDAALCNQLIYMEMTGSSATNTGKTGHQITAPASSVLVDAGAQLACCGCCRDGVSCM